jgi:hypothetical protein
MKAILGALLFASLSVSVATAATPVRKEMRGFFILEKNGLYFTEIYHSTAPVYRVQWWDDEKPSPLCAINLNPACQSVSITYEPKVETQGGRKQIILANAIFTQDSHSKDPSSSKLPH